MKNKEIPSTPKVKFKVNNGNQANLTTNWKKPTDLLKLPHKNKDPIKDKQAEFKPTNFISCVSRDGTNSNIKIPIIGNSSI
jgi:hypothetical protein